MNITIENATSNNLKNIVLDVPLNQIIGITGVSGSGKSTLVRDIISKWGYTNYVIDKNKSIKNLLIDYTPIDVKNIKNLPPVLFIDVLNQINNRRSTLSTITGIHNILRNMFYKCGELFCSKCNEEIYKDVYDIIKNLEYKALIDLEVSQDFERNIEILNKYIDVNNIIFYDKNKKVTKQKRSRKYATIYFDVLDNSLKKVFNLINLETGYEAKIYIKKYDITVNPDREVICEKCGNIMPKVSLKHFSFNILKEGNGGQCTVCDGLGEVLSAEMDSFIEDENKGILDGAIKFVSSKGIQYTNIDSQIIDIFAKNNGFRKNSKLKDLNDKQREALFYGSEYIINYKVKGEKRYLKFNGIINYLSESLSKGKGKKLLEPLFNIKKCTCCEGTRLNSYSNHVKIRGYTIKDFIKMSIDELNITIKKISNNTSKDSKIYNFYKLLIEKLNLYSKLSCGYLTLDRASNTLSGGELQRLRLGKYISESISSMCIILDEPTTGLHLKNITNILDVLYLLKSKGNTIILVEHNKFILSHCDYIVDLGPYGGKNGGNVLFSDYIKNIDNYDTFTTKYLLEGNNYQSKINLTEKYISDTLMILSNRKNNLKDFKIYLPKNFIISICGVSGSGKSTFVNKCLLPELENKYNGKFNVNYLPQNIGSKNSNNKVANLIGINEEIAKIYSKIEPNLEKKNFMLNSTKGKCSKCKGKGFLYSIDGDNLGYCDICNGNKFNKEVLSIKYENLNISDLLSKNIEELLTILEKEKNKTIYNALLVCKKLGIGYLSLDRSCKSLSKGEYQRAKLVNILNNKEKNMVIILDEPTKALHSKDLNALIDILKELQKNGNTIVVIEHNIDFIMQSDYILEFGPEAGEKGGYLIFAGYPKEIINFNTPTSEYIKYSIERNEQDYIGKNEINWHLKNNIYNIEKNKVNYINIEDANQLELIKKLIEYEYIRALIPSYNISEDVKKYNNCKIENTPLIRSIDFCNKSNKNNLTVLEFLNLEYEISKMFSKKYENKNYSLAKYIYNIHKKTGKCKVCKGTGRIKEIDISLLQDNGKLNYDTEKFLKEGSSYNIVKKELKKEYGIDIGIPFSQMIDEDKNIFMYGDNEKIINVNGRKYIWQGLVNILLQQSKYYPNKDVIEKIKNSIKIGRCPKCKGYLLEGEYANTEISNLKYSEILNMNIIDIWDYINKDKDCITEKFYDTLNMCVNLGLEHVKLNASLSNIRNIDYNLLKFVSFYNNNLYDSIICISNLNLIEEELVKKLEYYINKWCNTNTMILI